MRAMTNRGIADALERLQRAVEADDPHEIVDAITAEKWWLLPNHFPAMKAALAHVPASMIAEHPLLRIAQPLILLTSHSLTPAARSSGTSQQPVKTLTDTGELLVEMIVSRVSSDYPTACSAAKRLADLTMTNAMASGYHAEDPAPLSLLHIGITYMLAGQTREAIRALLWAKDLASESSYAFVYPDACAKLAVIFALRGSLHEAQRMLDESRKSDAVPVFMSEFLDTTQRVARAMIALTRMDHDAGTLVGELPGIDTLDELWPFIVFIKARFALGQKRPLEGLDIAELAFSSRPLVPGSLAAELLTSVLLDALLASDASERACCLIDFVAEPGQRTEVARARLLVRVGNHDDAEFVLQDLLNSDLDPTVRLGAQLLEAEIAHHRGIPLKLTLARAVAGQVLCGSRWLLTQTPSAVIVHIADALPPDERAAFERAVLPDGSDTSKASRIQLTRGETSVLQALSRTSTLDSAAAALHLSRNTVKTHLSAVYRKLGVNSKDDALQKARQLGIISGMPNDGPDQRVPHLDIRS